MTDATLEALRKAAGRGVIIVPTTGRNLECIPHRLAAGTLFTTGAMDEKKNRDLFRYVISSNGACVTDIRERKEIFRAPVPADDVLPLLRECGKLRLGIASHIRHRYLLEGRFLTMAGRLVYGKDARGVCCVRSMEEFIRKGGYKVEEFQFYFFSPGAEQDVRSVLEKYPDLRAAYRNLCGSLFERRIERAGACGTGATSGYQKRRDRLHRRRRERPVHVRGGRSEDRNGKCRRRSEKAGGSCDGQQCPRRRGESGGVDSETIGIWRKSNGNMSQMINLPVFPFSVYSSVTLRSCYPSVGLYDGFHMIDLLLSGFFGRNIIAPLPGRIIHLFL